MPRLHEPFADAIRNTRDIVEREGRALAKAYDGEVANDDDHIDRVKEVLIRRIAEAIVEAEEAGRDWASTKS